MLTSYAFFNMKTARAVFMPGCLHCHQLIGGWHENVIVFLLFCILSIISN